MSNSHTKKIKVLQITHDLAIGGLQQVIVNICRTIDRQKFDISVLCLRSLGEYVPEIEKLGIKVTLLPQKQDGVDYLSFLKVAKILRQERPDVIHTHNTQPFIDGTLGGLLAGVKKIIHTDHARSFPDNKRYMFAEWFMSHFAYRVVGVSEHTANNLIKYEKISPKKIKIIPNGIDATRFNITIDREKKKRELGITNNGPIIGLGVRLTEQKGITYLLQAMPAIIEKFPAITLVIVGEGPLMKQLKAEADSLEVTKNVLFLGPRLDIPELLQTFEIYVLPSLWEGLPMVLLEALAAGCPIIATKVGGVATAVEDGVNGTLVQPRDVKQLSRAIIKLLENQDLREEFSLNGRALFEKKFKAEIMTQNYERMFTDSLMRKAH